MGKCSNINIVTIRRGLRGSYTSSFPVAVYVPAYRTEPVDITGTGDVWTATFMVYLIFRNKDIETSMRYANVAGALRYFRNKVW
ncbi:MAG: PfkB family carbohydrate kinase [Desulfurococcaceae archaeon]